MTDLEWAKMKHDEYQTLVKKGMGRANASKKVREMFDALRLAQARQSNSLKKIKMKVLSRFETMHPATEIDAQSDKMRIFQNWYNTTGHWIYQSRGEALQVFKTVGIDGLPGYKVRK